MTGISLDVHLQFRAALDSIASSSVFARLSQDVHGRPSSVVQALAFVQHAGDKLGGPGQNTTVAERIPLLARHADLLRREVGRSEVRRVGLEQDAQSRWRIGRTAGAESAHDFGGVFVRGVRDDAGDADEGVGEVREDRVCEVGRVGEAASEGEEG
jgi:hypothetical protein